MSSKPVPLRLLSNNAYLVPWFFVAYEKLKGDEFAIASCQDQAARADRLGKLAKDFDLLLLQELWGGGNHSLSAHIQGTHQVLPRNRTWGGLLGTGLFADYLNSYLCNIANTNGGLFCAHRPEFKVIWEHHHNFVCNRGEESMYKSVSFVLLDLDQRWKGKFLLAINTHLHSPFPFANTEERRAQREEIRQLLIRLQREQPFPQGFEWKNCGVVFAGDFNIGYQNLDGEITEEYLETVKTSFGVELRDSFLECHPGSTQHSYDAASNKYVSCHDSSSRMDYAFFLDRLPCEAEGKTIEVMRLKAEECEVFVTPKGEEVSDHYPLLLSIVPDLGTLVAEI